MIKELKKLIYDRKIFIIIFMAIFLLFAFSIYYTATSKTEIVQNYGHRINKYLNDEQLDKWILQKKEEITNLDSSGIYYENEYKQLSEDLRIYEYLKENNIKYDEAVELYALSKNDNTRLRYFNYITSYSSLLLMVVIICLAFYIFTREIQDRESIFIYGNNVNKRKILIKKTILYFTIIISIVTLFSLIVYLLGLALPVPRNIILEFRKGEVISYSVNDFFIRTVLSLYFESICYGLIFLAIGLIFSKIYTYAIAVLLIYGLIKLLGFIDNEIIKSFIILPVYVYNMEINPNVFVIVSIIKVLLLVGFSYFGFIRFKHKRLA